MIDRALQHPLKAERRLGVALVAVRQDGHGFGDDGAQVLGELVQVGATTAQDRRSGRIGQQSEQQVLHGHELVALLAGLLVALADGEFEVLAEHASGSPGSFFLWPDMGAVTTFPSCKAEDADECASIRSPALPYFLRLRG